MYRQRGPHCRGPHRRGRGGIEPLAIRPLPGSAKSPQGQNGLAVGLAQLEE